MDWPESTEPLIVAFPRGRKRDGGLLITKVVVPDNPLCWTSTYASLITTVYGIGTVDGLNERGLGVHALYLKSTDVGTRNAELPGLHTGLWAQYLLDQAGSVTEALALMDGIQLVMVSAHGHDATLHLAIEDADGDSAIVELAAGQLVVHHGREFTLMTNDPTYNEQLKLLAAQDFSHPSCDLPFPATSMPSTDSSGPPTTRRCSPSRSTSARPSQASWRSCATSRCHSARHTPNSASTTPSTARCAI
jgi:choloylglycine hydrolase